MNKIEKTIVEVVCREWGKNNSYTEPDKYSLQFDIPKIRILGKIGITYEQATEVLDSFQKEGHIEEIKAIADGWNIKVDPAKIMNLFNLSIQGIKLTADQSSLRRRIESVISNIDKIKSKTSSYNKLQEEFNQGKWLRLCCASCGDFIQEVTSYEQLNTLKGQEIECPRRQHKNNFRLNGDIVEFSSINTNIFEILKEPKLTK